MEKIKKVWWKELIPYVVIVIVVLLVRTFIVTPVQVSGSSMEPTLDGGEIMFLWKTKNIKRYDIVVANLVKDGKKVDILIKRVYGLPGEKIQIENGKVYINDHVIDDMYGVGDTGDGVLYTLGEDEYFIMGDNRNVSYDSRYIGPFKSKDIEGITNFIVFPFSKFGNVK